MPESFSSAPRSGRAVLVWAVAATVAAFIFGNAALVLLVKWRDSNARLAQATASGRNALVPVHGMAGVADGFRALQENEVAGRYHLFQEGTNVGMITLLPDHSIINKDGTTFPQYHWEIQPDGLMTTWQRGRIFFNVLVKPGVYVARFQGNNDYRRLEKVEE
jgi:hypothetical protein